MSSEYTLEVGPWYIIPSQAVCTRKAWLTFAKNAFGITVSTKMLSVHARILPAPLVKYHEQSLTPKLAEWNLHGKKFISHVSMSTNKWSYLSLSGQEITNEHWHDFETALSSCGMGDCVPDPWRGFEARLHGPSDDDENDSAIHTAIQNAKDNSVRMLWVILPSKSAGIYARIKYWADVKIGMLETEAGWGLIADTCYRHPYCLRTSRKAWQRPNVLRQCHTQVQLEAWWNQSQSLRDRSGYLTRWRYNGSRY